MNPREKKKEEMMAVMNGDGMSKTIYEALDDIQSLLLNAWEELQEFPKGGSAELMDDVGDFMATVDDLVERIGGRMEEVGE